MRNAIIGRFAGGILLFIISIMAWRVNGDHRSTIILLIAAWSAYGVGVVRFLMASRRQGKR